MCSLPPPSFSLQIAKHSVEDSKIFAMNLSAPFLIQFFGDQMAATMPYTDFVFGNEVGLM